VVHADRGGLRRAGSPERVKWRGFGKMAAQRRVSTCVVFRKRANAEKNSKRLLWKHFLYKRKNLLFFWLAS
jgi:hypothetical protein